MEALDFQVEIGRGAGQSYEVTWRAPDGSETSGLTRVAVSPDELRALAARVPEAVLASSAQVRRSVAPEERPIQELGRLLFDALLPGTGRALLAAARHRAGHEERRLRVILRVRPPELARLPWEFLFDEGQNDYVCPTTTLIRHPQVAAPLRPLKVQPPLRILCMAAAPDDQEPLAVRSEQQRLSSALTGLEREGLIELGWTAGDTWRDLRTALRRTGDVQWHVFHFIGHGGFDATAQEGTLRLSAEEGGTYDLGAENLAMVLEGMPSLRLVVLNACETGRSSAADPFSSVAGALMQRGVPAALAMQFPISDRAAEEFSRTFYEGLAHRMPVDAAVTDARQAIRLALRGTLEWGTPVLYMRSLDGLLFDFRTAPTARRDTGELHDLYVQGLAALYTERWDDAVAAFRAVVAQNPTYQSGKAKLNEAVRGRRLASLYAAGTGAADHGHWDAAVEHLGAVVGTEPDYRDAAERLRRARHAQAIAALRTEIADLHRAGQWQAVLAVGARLAALSPDDPDPGGLVAAARQAYEQAHGALPEHPADETDPVGGAPRRDADGPGASGAASRRTADVADPVGKAPRRDADGPGASGEASRRPADAADPVGGALRRDADGPGASGAASRHTADAATPARETPTHTPDPADAVPPEAAVETARPGHPRADPRTEPPVLLPHAERPEPPAPHSRTESPVILPRPGTTELSPPADDLSRVRRDTSPGGDEGLPSLVVPSHPREPGTSASTLGWTAPLWREPAAPNADRGSMPPRPSMPPVVGRMPEPVRPGDVPLSWQPGARSFAFSQDGSRVALGHQSGGADVFDLGGHVVAALRRDVAWNARITRAARLVGVRTDDAVTCLALTPNGGQLATAQDATARIWSLAKSVELRQMRLPDTVCAVSFSPVGHRVVFATVAPAAYVWDTTDPAARRLRLRLDAIPHRLAWSPDGLRFGTAGPTGARMWSVVSGEHVLEVGRGLPALDIAVSPLGARLALAQGGARVLDARSGVEVHRLGGRTSVARVAFNRDGTRLVTADRGGMEIWDMRSGEQVARRRFDVRWAVEAVAFGPDGAARALLRVPESVWLIRLGEEHDG